jgi:hypothetical protein
MIKTAQNKNIYIEREENGALPATPAPRAYRWVGDSLEGSYEAIQNDTKFPGRNPEKDRRGTDSSAGDFTAKLAPLELDNLLEAVLCGSWSPNSTLSDATYDVSDLVPGSTQRTFYMLKEYNQSPVKYQLFTGLQANSLNLQFTVKSFVNAVFNLMGGNNPRMVDAAPVSLANKAAAMTTEQFTTLEGFIKFKGEGESVFTQLRDCSDLSLSINNNMKSLDALFEVEAIEKSLGLLDISGSLTEYLNDGYLYNKAKNGESGELDFEISGNGYRYEFILRITFDNSSLSGEEELSVSLPFKTYGADRFTLRKYAPLNP